MFCRKCGKEIEDGSKYCPYCGRNIEEPPDDEWEEMDDSDIPSAKIEKSSWKKFVIPAGAVVGVAVIATVGVLAVNHGKQKPVDSKKVVSQENKSDKQDKTETEKQTGSDTTSKQKEADNDTTASVQTAKVSEYPKDITLDADVQDKLTRFIHILAEVDFRGLNDVSVAELSKTDKGEFGQDFLFFSLWYEHELTTGKVFNPSATYWEMKSEALNFYLLNSLNSTEFTGDYVISGSEGCIHMGLSNAPGALAVESYQIENVTAMSEQDIQLSGTAQYSDVGQLKNPIYFRITMTVNPESMWGGYTLKEIISWGEESTTAPTSDYVLADIASRYYAESELSGMDAHGLYIARNELYARHGYIFNNNDLKQYFGTKSWYQPTTTTVPDSAFNKYEKANLDLILALEEKFK